MATELYDRHGNRVETRSAGGVLFTLFLCAGFTIMIAVMVASYIGYNPWKQTTTIDALPTQPARPTVQVAPPPVPVPAPVIVQSVPQGAAPQSITIATPVVPVSEPGSSPVAPPAPAPVVIVLHENDNHGAPIVTGSGACAVAAKGARRCGR